MVEANGGRVGGLSRRALPAGLANVTWRKGGTMVASEITHPVGDGARSISAFRAALVFILGLAAMSAQAGQAPGEPYSCRLYANAGGHCALLNCSDRVMSGGCIV